MQSIVSNSSRDWIGFFLPCFYTKISSISAENGNYDTALWFLEKSSAIFQASVPLSSDIFIQIYEDMAQIYIKKQDIVKTLESYEKVLKLQLERLPSNHLKLALTYSAIAELLVLEKDMTKR
ncbi:hypothetical protein I4U23_011026 [Adineta vaga]|nr:hypothetical protein I4U23_011026 [Adineta vaga]